MNNNKNKVGLGTFPLGSVFNEISPLEAEKIVRHFLDNGGYYIDTAPMYGNGEIEKLLGRVLKDYQRDKYYLITKAVYNLDKMGELFKSGKHDDVINEMDKSLDRLGVDYVDQLMVHSPDKTVSIDETLGALEEIQKAGKAKVLSVSNVDLDELKAFNKTGKIKYVENRFSFVSRSLSPDFEEYLLDNNIKLIPYHLLEIGLLTEIAFEDYKLRTGDLREKLPYWNNENQKIIFDFVRNKMSPVAKKLGITIGQLNQAWALHQDFIDFIIVGTTRPDYLDINLKSNDIKLDNKTLLELEKIYLEFKGSVETKYKKTLREFRGLNEKYY